jgi:ABC-type multidrug transport system ATPase subunit
MQERWPLRAVAGPHRSSQVVRLDEPVDGVSFGLASGETCGLLGPYGAGKTTIISMVVGVSEADAGTAQVDALSVEPDTLDVKARIDYVPPGRRSLS